MIFLHYLVEGVFLILMLSVNVDLDKENFYKIGFQVERIEVQMQCIQGD